MNSHNTSACRLCGIKTNLYLIDVRGHKLEKCPECGFVQVAEQPDPQELENIYQEAYFNHGKYKDLETLRIENLRRLQMLLGHVKHRASVLEVGCGEGSFINLAKSTYQFSGFDLSEKGIEIARKQNCEIADHIWVGNVEGHAEPGKQLKAKIINLQTKWKKVNLGFLLYKLYRVFPRLPGIFLRIVKRSTSLSKITLNVPTDDIQYISVKKG